MKNTTCVGLFEDICVVYNSEHVENLLLRLHFSRSAKMHVTNDLSGLLINVMLIWFWNRLEHPLRFLGLVQMTLRIDTTLQFHGFEISRI